MTEIKDAGWSTQYITASDVTIPSGIEAFAGVVNTSAGTITLASIIEKIKAGEPVILKGNAGLYNFMPTTGASNITNDLQGSDGNVQGGAGIYALSNRDNGVGFYPVSKTITIPAGKAYIEYTAPDPSNPVKGFTFLFDDDATSIQTIDNRRCYL